MKRKIFPLFAILLLTGLVACQGTPSSSVTDSHPSEGESSSISSEEDSSFEELSTNEINYGQVGGRLIDIAMNTYLKPNFSYEASFSPDNTNKTIRLTSSNENVLTIEPKPGSTTNNIFNLVTHEVGDAILCIYDVDDFLVYRKVVRVRPEIKPEDMPEYLFEQEKWVNLNNFGNYQIIFTNIEPQSGIYRGSDDYEGDQEIYFDYEYAEYIEDRDFYSFPITITDKNETTTTEITSFQVSSTGDMMLLYFRNGSQESLLTELVPESLLYLHRR